MALWDIRWRSDDAAAQLQAINRTQAVIEFDTGGKITYANKNFLDLMGYAPAEVVGSQHGMFVEKDERNGAAYREFWDRLRRGEHQSGEFRRSAKDGKEVWIKATYTPIADRTGKSSRSSNLPATSPRRNRRVCTTPGDWPRSSVRRR